MGGIDAIVVANTSAAITALGVSFRGERRWILPRVDCVRPFRFGVSSTSNLRAILDEIGAEVSEVGSNQECLRSDLDAIPTFDSSALLSATPGGTADPDAAARYLADLSQWAAQHQSPWVEVLFNASLHALPEHASLTSVVADRWLHGMDLLVVPCDMWIGGPECCLILTRKNNPSWEKVQRVVLNLGLEAPMITQSILLKVLQTTESFEGWQSTHAARSLCVGAENLRFRAEKMALQLSGLGKIELASVVEKDYRVGMGVWSRSRWKSAALQVRMHGISPSELAKRLSEGERPIWCQVQSDCIELVLRTIDPDEDRYLVQRLSEEAGAAEAWTESESRTNNANTSSS
jgi:seryl-tRNA(Sec) selenium transferase